MVRMLNAASIGGVAPAGPRPEPWPALREELRLVPAAANADGSPAWHICDPVRNLYFRIGWLEQECLRRWHLGDARSIAQAVARETTLWPEPADVMALQVFLSRHHLLRRRPERSVRSWSKALLDNYLFIRVPLIRPWRWLAATLPWVRWLGSRWFLALTVLAALGGLALAARQWDVALAQWKHSLTLQGAAAYALALLVSKLLHELAHAYVATAQGVRVGHMGVALLVLWPMPYTDTGESWKLGLARQRLAIASAGIAAELALAAWTTLAWSFLPDGPLRTACLFLATTAWLLTLAVNASPFMRFDGYFMLADAVDTPGLHERAGTLARAHLRRLLLGLRETASEGASRARRMAMISFAYTTWMYRLVVFFGIALLVYHVFFKALGVFLFAVEIGVFIALPIWMETRVWFRRRAEVPWWRWLVLLGVLSALAALVLVPWWGRVSAPGVLRAAEEQAVYTPVPARLSSTVLPRGTAVDAGQALLRLEAPLQAEERAKAEAMSAAWRRQAQGALGVDDETRAAKLALAETSAARFDAERQARARELARLQVVAPFAGKLRESDDTTHPGTWVSPRNSLGLLVKNDAWRVEALVTEHERARIAVGDAAKLYLEGSDHVRQGKVTAIDDAVVQRLPHLMLAREHGGPIALSPTAPRQALKPAESWYRVIVTGVDAPVDAQRRVQVHFATAPQSFGERWLANIASTLVQHAGP